MTDNNDNWFKPIGNDKPLPTKATKSPHNYKQMTSRYAHDKHGNAVMDSPRHKGKMKGLRKAQKRHQNWIKRQMGSK